MTIHERINQLCELLNQHEHLKLPALTLIECFRHSAFTIIAAGLPTPEMHRRLDEARELLAAALCELLAPLNLDHGQEQPHVVTP